MGRQIVHVEPSDAGRARAGDLIWDRDDAAPFDVSPERQDAFCQCLELSSVPEKKEEELFARDQGSESGFEICEGLLWNLERAKHHAPSSDSSSTIEPNRSPLSFSANSQRTLPEADDDRAKISALTANTSASGRRCSRRAKAPMTRARQTVPPLSSAPIARGL